MQAGEERFGVPQRKDIQLFAMENKRTRSHPFVPDR
jgi:hypothetical protein